MFRSFREVKPGGQLSASELNRAFAEVERQNRISCDAPLELIKGTEGNKLRLGGRWPRWAVITDVDQYGTRDAVCYGEAAYSWQDAATDECGNFSQNLSGGSGTFNAYSDDPSIVYEVGDVVYIIPSPTAPIWIILTAAAGTGGGGDSFLVLRDNGTEFPTATGVPTIYDADLPSPQWNSSQLDFPQTAGGGTILTKCWYVDRRRAALAEEEIVAAHQIGTFDPHTFNPYRASDPRPLYGGMASTCRHDLVVTAAYGPTDSGGIHFWECQREYFRPSTKSYQTREGTCWLIDKFNFAEAFRVGNQVEADLICYLDVDGSGPKPVYKCAVTYLSSDFLVCFENRVLSRGGWFAIVGGVQQFIEKVDGSCVEATDLYTKCESD